MTSYVALLRAVNVGGTGKLPMTKLRAMCEDCGFKDVRTYIASGNVLFKADLGETVVQAKLEAQLRGYAGKPVGVTVRTGPEMAAVLAANPFREAAPNRVVAIFLKEPPPADLLDKVTGLACEEIAIGVREVYVHYPGGQADTRLKIPAASSGTARNMNTVAKLVERMLAPTSG